MEKALMMERLNNGNYLTWSIKMKMVLIREDCWQVVKDEVPLLVDAEDVERLNDKALSLIVLAVDNDQLVHVRNCETGREAWLALKVYHQQATVGHKIRIMKRLFRSQLTKGGSIKEHLRMISEGLDELADIGSPLDDGIAVSVILASLNDDYDGIITAMEAWDEVRLTLGNVKAKLIEEYEKKNEKTVDDVAMVTTNKKDEKYGFDGKGYGGYENRYDRYEGRYDNRYDNRGCFNCGEGSHYFRNCPKRMKENNYNDLRKKLNENKYGDNNKFGSAKQARFNKWYSCLLFSETNMKGWYVDSGASNHMCNDEKFFVHLYVKEESNIILADGDKIISNKFGDVKLSIRISDNEVVDVLIKDVLYVPGIKGNLISVRKLVLSGFDVLFKNDECCILKDDDFLTIAKFENGLYKVISCENSEVLLVVQQEKKKCCIHEWHKVMAHRNLSDIRKMGTQGLHIEICACSDVCESCIKGKMSTTPFSTSQTKFESTLDCIVSDVCGPLQVESIGRSKYFVTFIDLYSKYCEIHFMRSKDETKEKVIQFVEKMKTQFGKKPKIFRSDKGGEYMCHDLQTYLRNEGIAYQCTVGYAPQQNGVAERKNRTLIETATTMICESGLPKNCWAEAVRHGNYVLNRIISSSSDITPLEMFTKEKPDWTEMKVFGSDVYSMIPKEKRRKLDEKAVKMKFVGIDEQSKGYRLYDFEKKNVIVSRNVKFLYTNTIETNEVVHEDSGEFLIDLSKNLKKEDHEDKETNDENDESYETATEDNEDEEHTIEEENIVPENIPLRRSVRQCVLQKRNNIHACIVNEEKSFFEPKTFNEAINCADKKLWIEAMEEELLAISNNNTWNLTDLPKGRTAIGSKWVFKIKLDEKGCVSKYKARLVAQGFSQKFGVDYDEVFAPVVRSTTLKLLLSIAGRKKYMVKHYDVKTAFLNGDLDEDIYMKQPPGFQNGKKVCKLNKSLYGLKQAARVWNQALHNVLINSGCRQNNADKCFYTLKKEEKVVYILIHVDDILVVGNDMQLMDFVMNSVKSRFEIKDLGEVKHYLGIEIKKDTDGHYLLNQETYIDKIVKEARLNDSKISSYPLDPGYYRIEDNSFLENNEEYRKLIGMLLYLSTNTRPDISATISILSQRISKPRMIDMNELKRLIKYLKSTKSFSLKLSFNNFNDIFCAYSDANFAEDRYDRKSNTGFACFMNGGLISWCCRKQDIVAQSSTEAEYVALSETCKEVIWIKQILKDFDIVVEDKTKIFTDNQGCIKMIKDQKFSNRTKHIDVKYHLIKEHAEKGNIILEYCHTNSNIADMLTKPLGPLKLSKFRTNAGLLV